MRHVPPMMYHSCSISALLLLMSHVLQRFFVTNASLSPRRTSLLLRPAAAAAAAAVLLQIEELKVAREEAEHLRTELLRLREDYDSTMHELGDVRRHHKDALDRLQQQSEALLYALNHYKSKGADATVVEQVGLPPPRLWVDPKLC